MRTTMIRSLPCLLGIAAALNAAPLHAQLDSMEVVRLRQIPPGTTVRAAAPMGLLVGRLHAVSGDTLYFDGQALPLSTVDEVWLRQRSTRRGIGLGAAIGAPIGSVTGMLFLLFSAAFCEYECSDVHLGSIAGSILVGAAAGATAGGIVGGTIGASVPRWVELGSVRLPASPTIPAGARGARTIGSISFQPVLARAEIGDDVGAGARMAYTFHTPHISFGPEIGYYGLGTNVRPRWAWCDDFQPCTDTVARSESVFHAGAIARVGTGVHRSVEPFASLGFGAYKWNLGGDGIELGGYSAGAGLQLRNASRRRVLTAELRWQSNLTRSGDEDAAYGFYTLGVGGSLAW